MNRRKKNSTKSTEHAPRMPNTECRHSVRQLCILAEGAIALSVTLSGRALVPSGCSRQLSGRAAWAARQPTPWAAPNGPLGLYTVVPGHAASLTGPRTG